MLGIQPDEVDPELGYIVPGESDERGGYLVRQFVEKPPAALAQDLIRRGALWNAFIVAAQAEALLDLFLRTQPQLVADMRAVVSHDCSDPAAPVAARHLYKTLPEIDFSRHVMQENEAVLRVVAVPQCGWSDLGTPKRVGQTLERTPPRKLSGADVRSPLAGHLNLAKQYEQLRM